MELTVAIIRLASAGGLLALLAACSNSPEPYILANWKAGDDSHYAVATLAPQTGPNGKPTLSICYSKAANSVDEIRRLVAANCTNPPASNSNR